MKLLQTHLAQSIGLRVVYVKSGAMPAAARFCIWASDGLAEKRSAASTIFVNRVRSEAVFRKTPGRPRT